MSAGGGSTTHKELLTAQTRVLNNSFGYIRPLALMVAVQLGIPDAVHGHGGPISLPDLASAVGVAGDGKVWALRRLMRALSHFGFFERSVVKAAAGDGERAFKEEEEEEVYGPTVISGYLVKDSPTTAAPLLLLITYPLLVSSWYSMAAWFRGERPESETVIEAAHGGTFFELLGRTAEFNGVVNNAMACDARWAMAVVTREHPKVFRGLTSLVDVGGGNGTAAKAIKDAFPDMRCTVLELPHVIAASPAVEGVDFVEGDMFEHVPTADAVLLKWVLHDWNDEDGVRILPQCREAVSATPTRERGGKVIIVDMVMRDGGGGDWEEVEAQHLFDLHMLAVTGGIERTEVEWRRILAAAGFSGCKITPALGPRSIIEAYP